MAEKPQDTIQVYGFSNYRPTSRPIGENKETVKAHIAVSMFLIFFATVMVIFHPDKLLFFSDEGVGACVESKEGTPLE